MFDIPFSDKSADVNLKAASWGSATRASTQYEPQSAPLKAFAELPAAFFTCLTGALALILL